MDARPRHDVKLSKTLAWLLRHQAVSQGLDIRQDGFVPCSQVVSLLAKRCIPGMTFRSLENEVAACPKQRFELSPCREYVRASRGHSIRAVDDTQLLTLAHLDDVAALQPTYGVSQAAWDGIKATGLHCGSKNHLHIATRACTTGFAMGKANKNANVVIHINVKDAANDGIVFYTARNGALLTRGLGDSGCLPAKYFSRAVLHNADGTETELLPIKS